MNYSLTLMKEGLRHSLCCSLWHLRGVSLDLGAILKKEGHFHTHDRVDCISGRGLSWRRDAERCGIAPSMLDCRPGAASSR